jgi:hypothetical protein
VGAVWLGRPSNLAAVEVTLGCRVSINSCIVVFLSSREGFENFLHLYPNYRKQA